MQIHLGYKILQSELNTKWLFSHGEGKVVGLNIDKFKHLIAFQYCDFNGNATLNGRFNPNGSCRENHACPRSKRLLGWSTP